MTQRRNDASTRQSNEQHRSGSMVEAAAEAVGRAAERVVGAVKGITAMRGESGSLHDAFLEELRDAYDAEKQLVKALPKLARAAAADALRSAFEHHLEQTRGHVAQLEQVFALFGQRQRGKHCEGIAGILEEGRAVMQGDFDEPTMDACLIAAAQRTEHYEMAAYGTLVAWANAMGRADAAQVLDAILGEEKVADAKLNALAEGGINEQAAVGVNAEQNNDAASRSSQRRARSAHRRRGRTKGGRRR
jgi:ferritin-like metal-binding protein YciE